MLLLGVSPGARAQNTANPPPPADFVQPARDLAQKIVDAAGPRAKLTLDLRNISSLTAADVSRIHAALEAALRATGATLVAAPPADSDVRVTLSENPVSFLWVAEIRRAGSQQDVMVALPKPVSASLAFSPQQYVLVKKLILAQPEPILDFLFVGGGTEAKSWMLVLGPERVSAFRSGDGHWELQSSAGIRHEGFWPRDLRGRFAVTSQGIVAFLPGEKCGITVEQQLSLTCSVSQEPWIISSDRGIITSAAFSARRNFFVGSLGPSQSGTKEPSFYSMGMDSAGQVPRSVVETRDDGRELLFQEGPEPGAEFAGWGSDIASLSLECGNKWQLFVTRPGDWTQPDAIQVFEIVERQAVALSEPVELDGPVTALWTASDTKSVNAVVHNLKTGQYEAYSLTINCSQ
jgi:hypothetical protein